MKQSGRNSSFLLPFFVLLLVVGFAFVGSVAYAASVLAFTQHPESATVAAGGSVNFDANFSDPTAVQFSYAWWAATPDKPNSWFNHNGRPGWEQELPTGTTVSGSTTNSLIIKNVTASMSGWRFRVNVLANLLLSNGRHQWTYFESNVATLTVTSSGGSSGGGSSGETPAPGGGETPITPGKDSGGGGCSVGIGAAVLSLAAGFALKKRA
jgi:hypothetical protein